ncbi:MAG: type IV pilus twitching motility protein PilT [Desulfovibrionaceae bacterium]
MAQINAFFKMLHEHGGSDLHLSTGSQPLLRLKGDLVRIKYKPLSGEELRRLLYEITPPDKVKLFEETGDVDFAYEVPGLARYRVNLFLQQRGPAAVFREIPQHIKNMTELGLPDALRDLVMLKKGIVLVTGPTGSGKSTTLAAMIDYANTNRKDHVLTIEDPIEFVHENRGCLINQREVGRDTKNFKAALRGALREDPDIILVGEMRDYETIALALEAAETGHLVLSTLHTVSAVKTVDRIIEVFPEEMQAQVRTSFADSFRAIISQTLLKTRDGKGRVVALDILMGIPSVRNLIRKGDNHQIPSIMQTAKQHGMQPLDDHILELVNKGTISAETGLAHALDKAKMQAALGIGGNG